MISRTELRQLAWERLKDAKALLQANRFEGAMYLGGYVVELALKARICRTLKWNEFPETRSEFQDYQSFKTHNLKVLLKLSGVDTKVKTQYFAEWSKVQDWNPESRYKAVGTATKATAEASLEAAEILLRAL